MSYKLLKSYIKLIFESKLPPSANGITTGRSGFSKNQQTPNIAGGKVNVQIKDQRIQSPDDGFYYQYMQVDGPNQDQYTGETFAICKIDKKFKDLFDSSLMNYKIYAKGVDADVEINNKIKQFYLMIKTKIDSAINNNQHLDSDNVYNYDGKKKSQSW
jgi:hypothetical protein